METGPHRDRLLFPSAGLTLRPIFFEPIKKSLNSLKISSRDGLKTGKRRVRFIYELFVMIWTTSRQVRVGTQVNYGLLAAVVPPPNPALTVNNGPNLKTRMRKLMRVFLYEQASHFGAM